MKDSVVPVTVRLLHWGLALLILLNLYVFEHGKSFHQYAGYSAISIVFLRILIGRFFYQKSFSFRRFEFRLSELKKFLSALFKGEKKYFKGHNPIASYVYLGIWLIVCSQGISGFLMKEIDVFFGNEVLQNTHKIMSQVLIALIILHLIGVAQDSLHFKRKTWKRMLTGRSS